MTLSILPRTIPPANNVLQPITARADDRSEPPLVRQATRAIGAAREFARRALRPDGHWCAEIESNTTITAEYVFMRQALGLDLTSKREAMVRYFFGQQKPDGSWGVATNHAGDISITAETYLALRILGVSAHDPRLLHARQYILIHGGLERMRVFTRIFFAMFGLFPWSAVPSLPPEFVLLPTACPVNVYALSSWARGTIVPLLILLHHKPVFALPNGRSEHNDWIDELWLDPKNKSVPYSNSLLRVAFETGASWSTLFTAADGLLRAYDSTQKRLGRPLSSVRRYALEKCEEWILDRQEANGDWGGIFPPMLNVVLALHVSGYSLEEGPLARGMEALERFSVADEAGFRIEPCQSPVWDTVLMATALLDCGDRDSSLARAFSWVKKLQVVAAYGDWRVYNREGKPGGWSFEYTNTWYPDVDDTAAVVIGLLKQDPSSRTSAGVARAADWIVSMQNDDGGWAAFDKQNDKLFLNEIPFSDMDALCDPSTPDIVGRVLEALGILGDPKYKRACEHGIRYLRRTQEPEGSWFGRWGVNYVYGTSNVLCGLAHHRIDPTDPMLRRALAWLKSAQNADGGWGECLESYENRALMGKGPSTPSQTAWATLGLLAHLPREDESVQRGIRWLIEYQNEAGSWDEAEFTGTGFPGHFYLRYNFYRHYFPLMALGRFARAPGARTGLA